MTPKIEADLNSGSLVVRMIANLITQIDPERLTRITIDNNVADSVSVDSLIGRTAHICYLDNQVVAEQIVYSLYSYLS